MKKSIPWVTLMAAGVAFCVCTGCIEQDGLLKALADDLAFTAAAGTSGFLGGLFSRFGF